MCLYYALMKGAFKMFITTKDICKNCELGLKRADCSETEFEECYEEKADLLTFKAMLNHGVQKLNLDKYDVIGMLDDIYK